MEDFGNEQDADRVSGPSHWNCREVDASNLEGLENAIWEIFRRKYDCLIVRNALPPAICDQIVAGSAQLPADDKSLIQGGWTFPPIFHSLADALGRQDGAGRRKTLEAYFQRCQTLSANEHLVLGVDMDGLVHDMLQRMAGNCNVAVPKGYQGEGVYAGCTLRAYPGHGQGFTSIQCGNYFRTVSQHFYEHLEGQVDVFDQLGFFFMLQTAEEGGSLSLFNLEWEEGQTKTRVEEPDTVVLSDKTHRRVTAMEAQALNPRQGDWVIFAAGQIWHRLEPVLGNRERITLGGYAAYSYDKKSLYHWS